MQLWACIRLRRLILIVMIAVLLISTLIVLLPSLTTSDYRVRITTQTEGRVLPDGFYLYQNLTSQGIAINSITQDNNSLIIHFSSLEKRNNAAIILKKLLFDGYAFTD